MKRIIIYRGLVAAILLLAAATVRAEVAGIKDQSECLGTKIKDSAVLLDYLVDLSSQNSLQYYDANKKRFVFCMSADPKDANSVKIKTAISIGNTSSSPVVIYDLIVDGTQGGSLVLTAGSGETAFQNLKAEGLKNSILLQGKSTVLNSTLSCDAANTSPAITVTSNNNTFRKVAINECNQGLGVAGSYNMFHEVAIKKTAATESQVGEWGVTATGKVNRFLALQVLNYLVGATLSGENNKIMGLPVAEGAPGAQKTIDGQWVLPSKIVGFTKSFTAEDGNTVFTPLDDSVGAMFKSAGFLEASDVSGVERSALVLANDVTIQKNFALGGTLGAIVIGHSAITNAPYQPTLVTQNTFTTPATIKYVDADDAKAHTLLSVEWMGKHVPEGADYADRIVGKLLDQNNSRQLVELSVMEKLKDEKESSYNLFYDQTCPVVTAEEEITIKDKLSNTHHILVGEKYFVCSTESDGKTLLKMPLKYGVRFISNTPTVSVMSDDVLVADLSDITIFISGASTISPEGGGLMEGGDSSGSGLNGIAASPSAPRNDANIPDSIPMIGEAEAESGGGSAMTGGGMVLGGDTGPAAVGASAGCGGQMMPGIPAAPGMMLWWLVPVAGLWYVRKKR